MFARIFYHRSTCVPTSRARGGFAAARVGMVGGAVAIGALGIALAARGPQSRSSVVLPAPDEVVAAQLPAPRDPENRQAEGLADQSTHASVVAEGFPEDTAVLLAVAQETQAAPAVAVAAPITIRIDAIPTRGLGPPLPVDDVVVAHVANAKIESTGQQSQTAASQSVNSNADKGAEAKPAVGQPQAVKPVSLAHEDGKAARPERARPDQTGPEQTGPDETKPTTPTQGQIQLDLNTATKAQLELLPGIGPALAQRIIDHRTKLGTFASVDDLDGVRGIGPKNLAKLRPMVMVRPKQAPR